MLTSASGQLSSDPTTEALLEALRAVEHLPLTFEYDGHAMLPGYHVTEVKTARFQGLDCGANRESWTETFVQLWDVAGIPGVESDGMSVRKFLRIMAKFTKDVGPVGESKLTFELSGAGSAMRLFAADRITVADDRAVIVLAARPASCKPRDRWLDSDAPAPAVASRCCS